MFCMECSYIPMELFGKKHYDAVWGLPSATDGELGLCRAKFCRLGFAVSHRRRNFRRVCTAKP